MVDTLLLGGFMFYTLLTLIIWLLIGTPPVFLTFNPTLVAFILAILADLATHYPWPRKA